MNFSLPFPPREFPDRGTKWLLGHPEHLRHLLRILAADISDRIDFDHLSPLPNELLSESLRRQLADLVFTAPFQDQEKGEVTIFILVEHQSTPSPVMRLRVLSYMVQLWDGQRRQAERNQVPGSQWTFHPIIPVVSSGTTGRPRSSRRWSVPSKRIIATACVIRRSRLWARPSCSISSKKAKLEVGN